MRQRIISRYCKAVGRQLICLPETRQELLKGLWAELEELPPEHTESFKKLEVCYGKIPQTALELQEAVSAGERAMALERQRRRRLMTSLAAGLLILLLAMFIFLMWNTAPKFIVTGSPVYN